MVEENNEEKKLVKVELACGDRKHEGYIGVDIVPLPGVDIVHDLEKYPWPFEDNSIDDVIIEHFVEHVKDLMAFMNELYRVMKPGARCFIIAPYYTSVRAWQDPTHVNAISEATFIYYNKKWRDDEKLTHYPINCDFDFSYGFIYASDWQQRSEEAKTFGARHYFNVVTDIHIMMFKRKDEQPTDNT